MTALFLGMALSSAFAGDPPRWFVRPDGSRQCQPATARKKSALESELKKAKIKFIRTKNLSDGAMRIQVCGAPTGQLDAVEALPSQAKALSRLGFVEKPVALETGS